MRGALAFVGLAVFVAFAFEVADRSATASLVLRCVAVLGLVLLAVSLVRDRQDKRKGGR